MCKIVLIGAGNVSHHIGAQLHASGHSIVQVYSRTISSANSLAKSIEAEAIQKIDAITLNADVYLICVPDYAISSVALKLPKVEGIVAHTSGSTTMEVLNKHHNRGVFYPLQTFTKTDALNTNKSFPILIEAHNDRSLKELTKIAQNLSTQVEVYSSAQREKIHLSAVMVNNFTNHIMSVVEKYTEKESIDSTLLLPLLEETIKKLSTTKASDIQTGPAIRKDMETIDKHLKMLVDMPNIQSLYHFLSKSIQGFRED